MKKFEVSLEQLMDNKYPGMLPFKTTEDIEGCSALIGQEKAEKSMKFGVDMKVKGYNIYISGRSGMGRTTYAMETLRRASKRYDTPDDWCYVYNFENEYEPVALNLEPGMGKVFKQDMEYIIEQTIDKIPSEFSSEEYERQKTEMLEDYHNMKNDLIDDLNCSAESYNLQVRVTSTGFAFVPVVGGKPLSEAEYDDLGKDDRDVILKNISAMRMKAIDVLRKLKSMEKESTEKVKALDMEVGSCVIERLTADILRKYKTNDKVFRYIECVKDDILKNLDMFTDGINIHSLTKEQERLLSKYKVNLIVDNSDMKGAPVIYETNPTFTNLMGNVEYESNSGTITTDFLMIRAGSILKANGGFLVIKADDILKNYRSWESLKIVISRGKLKIEGIRSQLDLITITSIRPEAIPVDVKVVLIGTEHVYQLLYELDDEFCQLFKVKVEFDTDMERNDENIYKFSMLLGDYCRKKNIRHLDNTAVAALIEYSSRLAGSRKRLTTCMEDVLDIVEESSIWAEASGNRYISGRDVKKAILESKKRINLFEEKIMRGYSDNKIIMDVSGEAVGQINGLAVVETGGSSFGRPYRITASTYMGKSGIINIEREAQMSGNVHNKSVMIISGYIGEKYAKSIPLSLSAHICFEQLYGYIDGDSASVAELYAILSSLSNIPFRQSIAVTGSINQRGEIQPVGGINEKIEGFYRVCKMYGLNKRQGVIIPYRNVDDVLLEDQIIRDIKNGMFHIYAIKNVEEGIEILTGMRAGSADENGIFEKNTFNYCVSQKLKQLISNYNSLNSTNTGN